MLDEVRWGILGCGDVTERKSGPAFNKVAGSRLVMVMRRDGEKAADYAKRHGVPRWTDDAQTLIDDPEVNAIYVATPPGAHAELALRVTAAGKPCYVEKPMARNGAECREMRDAFTRAGLPLFIAYYRRALPRFRFVQETLAAAALGELREIRYRMTNDRHLAPLVGWRYDPDISGGGLFVDLGSHLLDLFDCWFGPLQKVQGQARNISGQGSVEDQVDMTFETLSGVSGRASWNFACRESGDRIELVGTEATVSCTCFGFEPVKVTDAKGRETLHPFPELENVQGPLIGEIVNSLRTGAPCCSTGESGTRTSEVIDAVLKNSVS